MAETDSSGSAATTKRNSRRLCRKGRGGSRNFLFLGGGGGKFSSERDFELFCGKLPLTKTTTCFSISERRSSLSREKLFCEQR